LDGDAHIDQQRPRRGGVTADALAGLAAQPPEQRSQRQIHRRRALRSLGVEGGDDDLAFAVAADLDARTVDAVGKAPK
jgi:hypothetical protein